LLDTSLELQAAINIFLTQLASNWLVWWADLKMHFDQFVGTFNPVASLPDDIISPWILIGITGGLVILLNALLLGRQSVPNGNHKHIKA
jgi:hypothetical protein